MPTASRFIRSGRRTVIVFLSYAYGGGVEDGTKLSRFKLTQQEPPVLDPKSETVLLTWRSGGHNGASLQFGPDGMLYISTGDSEVPSPPDPLNTGQDISDLLSSILRIDVDHEENGKAYAIPKDNPFLKTSNAMPEIWAFGFRNPWKISFDAKGVCGAAMSAGSCGR
jgi:glucose/arabinose dehydrogenase